MNEEAFLRALMASPDDHVLRSAYADWLEERGDARAGCLRRDGLFGHDSAWDAFVRTLARPFVSHHFQFDPAQTPFRQAIGWRGGLVTFEGQFQKATDWDEGLLSDLRVVWARNWGECARGACDCPIHPFLCDLPSERRPLFAADVLTALMPRDFQSAHVATLYAESIPYPGYHPGTPNDEIHTQFDRQFIFPRMQRPAAGAVVKPIDPADGNHGVLKRHVAGGQLFYVLLHAGSRPSDWVVLFAVGASPHGRRLLGVVTYQACHNLCD